MNKLYILAFVSLISSCTAAPSYAASFAGKGELIGTSCDVIEHGRKYGEPPKPADTNCYAVVDMQPQPKAFAVDKDYSELVGTDVAVIIKDDGKVSLVGKGK